MFSVFDPDVLLLDYETPTDLYFAYSSHVPWIEHFDRTATNLNVWILNSLITPFDTIYPYVEIWTSGLDDGFNEIFDFKVRCADLNAVNSLVEAIIEGRDINFDCAGTNWDFKEGQLCVGCNNNPCPIASWTSFLLPSMATWSSTECKTDVVKQKFAASISFAHEIYVKPTVPDINNVLVESFKSSLIVTVTITGRSPGGELYCKSFQRGVQPTGTAEFIISTAKYTWEQNEDEKIEVGSVEIVGLTSGVDYDIYCYASDPTGNGIALSKVLKTKVETRTACCRDLYFIQLPASVYQDTSVYSPGDFSYFFTFRVPVVPEDMITVRPIFLQRDEHSAVS